MERLDEILRFIDQHAEIEKHGFKLPHWQQPGACYFVTFRLADSIPQKKIDVWKDERDAWLLQHPKPWSDLTEQEYHERFSGQFEEWLDQSHGSCVLRSQEVSNLVAETLLFHDSEIYQLHSWVVMPNHVHGLFSLRPDERLEACLKSWKGVSGRRINQQLGKTGTLWQKNYFDRLIRNGEHFRNVSRYIRRNPEKGHVPAGEYRLFESELVRRLLDE